MTERDTIERMGSNFLEFWDYWHSLPKSQLVPDLRDYLDRAPPRLQPNISMMDSYAVNQMKVRHMGTAVTEILGELTGSDAHELYNDNVHDKAALVAWTATSHPCGYTVKRGLITTTGRPVQVNAIVLPISTSSADYKTLIAYNNIAPGDLPLAREQGLKAVNEFGDVNWLDIGAGTPSGYD